MLGEIFKIFGRRIWEADLGGGRILGGGFGRRIWEAGGFWEKNLDPL